MHKIELSLDARADLKSIARYTLENWGKVQTAMYMAELRKTIYSLENNPARKGKCRDDLLTGLRSIPHQKHYHIFYRIRGNTVEIIRILHHRRNWPHFFHEG